MRRRKLVAKVILVAAPVAGFSLAPMAHALPPGYVPHPIQACPKATVVPAPFLAGPTHPHCM